MQRVYLWPPALALCLFFASGSRELATPEFGLSFSPDKLGHFLLEGTDIPQVDAIVYLRPTKSSRLMVQSAGRGLRLHDDKDFCLLLDYGRVFENCGNPHSPIIPHGVGEKPEQEPNYMKQCSACFYIYDKRNVEDNRCPSCNHKEESDRDDEKNLERSLVTDVETFELIVSRTNIYRNGRTRHGQKYMTLKVANTYHTLFGSQVGQFFSCLNPDVKITYTKENKSKFKVLKIEPHQLIE